MHLLPLCDVAVVPSIFPEAFGMVAAEAAAAGCRRVVAAHSGLAEIAAGVGADYPPELSHLTSFPTGDADALRERLRELFALPAEERRALGARRPARGRAQLELDARGRAPARPRLPFLSVGDEQKVGYEELLATSRAAFEAGPGLHGRGRGGVRAARSSDARASSNRFEEVQAAAQGTDARADTSSAS